VVDVDPGFYVRFADLFQIEGTAGRFMLKQMALRLSSRPASSLIAPRQRSSPPSAVARSWGLSCWRQAHAKARQKGAKANAEARSCALTECRQAALPHCGPSTTAQQLAATEHHKQTNTAIPSATTGAMSATLEPGRRS